MNYHWNWAVLYTSPYFGWILTGFGLTCLISVLACMIALFIGTTVGIARTLDNRVAKICGTVYVELFRNVPLLVQLFIWFYVLPQILPSAWGTWLVRGLPYAPFWTAVVGLGIYTAANVGEQVRSGISAISRGQKEAAFAIGFSSFQAYRYIFLPIGFRMIIPSLTSVFLGVFKNSSLALTIGVMELTATTRQIEDYTFQTFEPFTAATLLYALVTFLTMGIMRVVERRMQVTGTLSLGSQ
jgi:glutamate/aspartate transport system permease protein